MLYLVPNFQNPTGLLIGRAKRAALLEWAERRDVLLVEDDPYRDLYFEDSATEADVRPIRADDRIRTGGVLEQLLEDAGAGLSRGVDRRAARRSRPSSSSRSRRRISAPASSISAIVHEACRRGILDRQAPMLRAHYQHKRDVMVAALRREFADDVTWPDPRGGFFLWATLPDAIDADAMIRAADRARRHLRLGQRVLRQRQRTASCACRSPRRRRQRIDEGVRRLAAAIREEASARVSGTGSPRQHGNAGRLAALAAREAAAPRASASRHS